MKRKKIVGSLTALMCAVTILAGCGNSTSSSAASSAGDTSVASTEDSDKPVLRVAMEAAYAPFNWTQTDDANGAYPISGTNEYANGYDVMVAKMICDTIGYKLEIYKTDWDSLILGLNSDKYDALICGMNILPERKESVAFSTPYRTTSNCIIVRKDNKYADAASVADLDGASAITQLNSNWEPLLPEIPNVNALPGVSTSNEIAAQVIAGKADVGIVDDPTASVMCMSNEDLKYIVFDEGKGFSSDGQESDKMGIAVRLDDKELLQKINDAIESNGFDETKQDEFMKKAISILPQAELQ